MPHLPGKLGRVPARPAQLVWVETDTVLVGCGLFSRSHASAGVGLLLAE